MERLAPVRPARGLQRLALADASYVNGPTLQRSRERRVELLGPVPADWRVLLLATEAAELLCSGGSPLYSGRRF